MKIWVLLPAYNEALSFPALLPKIHDTLSGAGFDHEIVVCDDGSRDGTAEMLIDYSSQYPLRVITHTLNRGLGETVRDLFEAAVELGGAEDIIVRMDCDDTHEPDVMLRMIERLGSDPVDVVIASRFQEGGGQMGVSTYRALISRCANLFMKAFFPVAGVREYSCGFRAYRWTTIAEAISVYGNQFVQLKGLGFTGTLEKLLKLHLNGARFGEVGFLLRYDQKQSDSKMVSSITTVGYFTMVVLYHWPFGGWRAQARARRAGRARAPEARNLAEAAAPKV